MRTAYIIGDRTKMGAIKDFENAEKHLKNFCFEVFNPKKHHAEVLRAAGYDEKEAAEMFMCYMRECDMVFILNGYEHSADALKEYKEAEFAGMPRSFQTWR